MYLSENTDFLIREHNNNFQCAYNFDKMKLFKMLSK